MNHGYRIDYGNITLRPLANSDLESLRIWRNDSHNNAYLSKIPVITSEKQKLWFENYLNNPDEVCFAIEETNKLKRMIGSLSLYCISDKTCMFGKILIGDTEARGVGLGVKATKAAVKIAFEDLDLTTVKLTVFKENVIAVNAYKRAGFSIVDEHTNDDGKIEYSMIIERKERIMHNMNRVKMLEFQQRGDDRGHLVIVEGNQDMPFDIKRVFYIYGSDENVVRGQHANRESEFVLINVAGKSKVRVRDGEGNEAIYCLNRPHTGIYLPTMVWKEMYDFSPDSVLLVLASTHYTPEEYIRDYDDFVRVISEEG